VIRALAFMVVLGAVTVLSIVDLATGDPDWLTWVMLVAGPVGMVAALGEYLDARRGR
jgi:uncharacterized membrane protein